MEEKWFAGVDLGGTTVKLAFISLEGEIITKWEIATNKNNHGVAITTDIAKAIDDKLDRLGEPKEKLAGIGMGAPGFIEMETGFIYQAINIGWKDFPLKDKLEGETNLPVTIDNDANIAALGEMWKGAGEGAKNLLCVTLGTGVGGGVIVNGDIVHGANGMAGEIGHVTVVPENGAPCNCGKRGCLETVASATGITRLAKEKLENGAESLLTPLYKGEKDMISAKAVFEAAERGDKLAKEVIDEVCFYLGLAISNLANALNPDKIVVGGGVSKAGEALLIPLKSYYKRFALPRVAEASEVVVATLGNDAGVIGGAWLAKSNS